MSRGRIPNTILLKLYHLLASHAEVEPLFGGNSSRLRSLVHAEKSRKINAVRVAYLLWPSGVGMKKVEKVAVLLSGGMDSALLLKWLLERDIPLTPIYVRSGLIWEEAEFRAAQRVVQAFGFDDRLVCLEAPLDDVLPRHWSVTGKEVPDANSPDEAVYIPGRNLVLLQKTALWCQQNSVSTITLGTLAANPFEDATEEFFQVWQRLFGLATGAQIQVWQPFREWNKNEILTQAKPEFLDLTFSCLTPIQEKHCGQCNKCAERQRAYRLAKWEDRTEYAR